MLGLPGTVTACLFDLDGVLTQHRSVHSAAWKQMFDEFLAPGRRDGRAVRAVHPAATTTATSTAGRGATASGRSSPSRGIALPEGDARRPAGAATVHGLGNRKNDLRPAPARAATASRSIDGLGAVRARRRATPGCARAVVSSSANAAQVLDAAGHRRPVRRAHRRRRRRASEACRASPRPTRSWPGPRRSGVRPGARPPCSRTRSPASRPGRPAASARRRRRPGRAGRRAAAARRRRRGDDLADCSTT